MTLVRVSGWDEVCTRVHSRAVEVGRLGIKPTLRSLFYWAADAQGLIVHSQGAYKQLSAKYARYREELGEIGVLEDKSRRFIINDTRIGLVPDEYLGWALDEILKNLRDNVWRLPRWHGQPEKVELWIEKEAITVLEAIAEELGVDAFPSRGFSSVTMLNEAAKRLVKAKLEDGLDVSVLILTDFDPSGVEIDTNYRYKLLEYGAEVSFERVAITPEQISRYNLPSIPPDDPSYARIRNDSRYAKWLQICRQSGVPPEPVELDALIGIYPEEFRRLIVEAVNRHFDVEADARRRREEEERRRVAEEVAEEFEKLLTKWREG